MGFGARGQTAGEEHGDALQDAAKETELTTSEGVDREGGGERAGDAAGRERTRTSGSEQERMGGSEPKREDERQVARDERRATMRPYTVLANPESQAPLVELYPATLKSVFA